MRATIMFVIKLAPAAITDITADIIDFFNSDLSFKYKLSFKEILNK